jgi:hypothetical protein
MSWMLYYFFWVIPQRVNFMRRRFITLCSNFIGRVNKKNVPKRRHGRFRGRGINQKKEYKSNNWLRHVLLACLSVATEQLGSHRTDPHEIWYLRIFWKFIVNVFMILSRGILLVMWNVSEKKEPFRKNTFYIQYSLEFLATDTEVPGSIPGATRFSE